MLSRSYSLADRLIGEIDKAIKVLSVPARANRTSPAGSGGEFVLEEAERVESGRLMRVNHAGEVAAQALYQGQALTARDPTVADAMRQAADEEMDHLAWCEERLKELKTPTSVLNPLWYLGSFALGAVAGAIGDRVSLGFIVETEKQVETHLHGHRDRLPAADHRSRAIIDQMTRDEVAHGAHAKEMGARELPRPIQIAMHLTSRVMTRSAYWL